MKIELTVNGLKIQAQYQNEEIENVHKPLLHMLAALQTVNPQRRTVVFLCAPPGGNYRGGNQRTGGCCGHGAFVEI